MLDTNSPMIVWWTDGNKEHKELVSDFHSADGWFVGEEKLSNAMFVLIGKDWFCVSTIDGEPINRKKDSLWNWKVYNVD